jgi:hypothetical protein
MYKHEWKKKKKTNINKCNMHECLHIKMDENYWNFIHSKDIKHFKMQAKILENIMLYGKMYFY